MGKSDTVDTYEGIMDLLGSNAYRCSWIRFWIWNFLDIVIGLSAVMWDIVTCKLKLQRSSVRVLTGEYDVKGFVDFVDCHSSRIKCFEIGKRTGVFEEYISLFGVECST